MRREYAEERAVLRVPRFIVTDGDLARIKLYNCLAFCAGFVARWPFPPPRITPAQRARMQRLGRDAFLSTAEGQTLLARTGPEYMERMAYEFHSKEPAEGPVIAMYAGDNDGPHVAKRLREGRPWYEGKCGTSGRIVHRLEELSRCPRYGRIIGFWVPTDETPQKWEEEAKRRALKLPEMSHGPILDSDQSNSEQLWTLISELEEEERRERVNLMLVPQT